MNIDLNETEACTICGQETRLGDEPGWGYADNGVPMPLCSVACTDSFYNADKPLYGPLRVSMSDIDADIRLGNVDPTDLADLERWAREIAEWHRAAFMPADAYAMDEAGELDGFKTEARRLFEAGFEIEGTRHLNYDDNAVEAVQDAVLMIAAYLRVRAAYLSVIATHPAAVSRDLGEFVHDVFYIDDLIEVIGMHDPRDRWNGFAIPYFTAGAVRDIMRQIERAQRDIDSEAFSVAIEERAEGFFWKDLDESDGAAGWQRIFPALTIDGIDYYDIGGRGWVWTARSDYED